MNNFSKKLKEIQAKENHKSAKRFYDDLLKKGLDCNYQYFIKCLQGKLTPSSGIVNQMALALNTHDGEELIKAFCVLRFPKFDHLFPHEIDHKPASPLKEFIPKKELTARQVAMIAKTETHYHLFLLLSLARFPLKTTEIETIFKINMHEIINDLLLVKIIYLDKNHLSPTHTDISFPSSPSLKKYYKNMDEWDKNFGHLFLFTPELKKTHLRRISWRYLNLIKAHLQLLFDTINSADEIDSKHNDEVIYLQVVLKSGKMIG